MTDDFVLNKFTPKQQRFIDIYCSNYGIKTARECAILAGYNAESAHSRANEMLDWKKFPEISAEIQKRLEACREVWNLTPEKYAAKLEFLFNEARQNKELGIATKIAELQGKLAGFFVEKNMLLYKDYNDMGNLTSDEALLKMNNLLDGIGLKIIPASMADGENTDLETEEIESKNKDTV